MDRIKFEPEPTEQELAAKRKAARAKLIGHSESRHSNKPAKDTKRSMDEALWELCYLFRLRDIMKARFGWSSWMGDLPRLAGSGVCRGEDGLYRPCNKTRVR